MILIYIFYMCFIELYSVSNAVQVTCELKSTCNAIFGQEADCVKQVCVCGDKQNLCAIKRQMNKVTTLDGACDLDNDCNINHTMCVKGQCKCLPDFIESQDKRACLKATAGLGEPCIDDVQCIAKIDNSKCTNKTICECADGYHKDGFKCWKNIELKQSCNTNEECYVQWSVCRINNCDCDENHVASEDLKQCLPFAVDKTSPCREEPQCKKLYGEGAACLGEGICGCSEFHSLVNSTCEQNSRLNLACSNHEECRNLDGNLLMDCVSGKCHCKLPYYEKEDVCINTATSVYSNFYVFLSVLLIMKML